MFRFALKSPLALAFALGLACAIPAATIAQAQAPRDTPNTRNINDPAAQRNINDPANQRNLNDTQDPNRSRLNDPANARNLNDTQDPKNSRVADPKAKKPGEQ
jgi:hypothetical protein